MDNAGQSRNNCWNAWRKMLLLIIGLTFAWIGVTPMARSDCSEWHLSDKFTFIQDDGRKVTFGFLRRGEDITGEAYYYDKRLFEGEVKGYIDGDTLNVTVDWQPPRREIYEGCIDAQGYLSGTMYDDDHPDHHASWYAKQRIRCASH